MRALTLLLLTACRGGAPSDAADSGADSGAADSGDSGTDTAGDSGAGDSGADTSGDSGASGADTASPWERPDPAWDAAEVGARIDAALAAGLPDSPALLALLVELTAHGDPDGCPHFTPYTMAESFVGCSARTGWTYVGLTIWAPDDPELTSYQLTGDCFIRDPEGNVFECAGEIELTGRGEQDWALRVAGRWGYPLAAGWLGAVPDLAVWIDATPEATSLVGGFQPGASDSEADALYFDDVLVGADGAVSGAIRLRDPSRSWYVLTLDGTPDGCGAVTWGDDALGRACVDLATPVADLRARQEAP